MAALKDGIRELVSKKKQRYKGEGYNLDLSYITDRLIAMGFPAQNFESIYRNSMDDVKRFLDEKHKDHFKIYNLCSERGYDPAKFYDRVVHFPFDDHHPPKFDDIKSFCEDVTKWLQQNQKNVAVVHCKAGKGRTGVMICCYLLHSKLCESAEESLNYYGRQRTQNEKGVTIPSQRRYINYYERLLKTPHLNYQPVKLYLSTLVLDPVPNFNTPPFGGSVDSCYLQFTVNQRSRIQPYVSEWYLVRRGDRQSRLEVDPPLLLREDVKIEFHVKPRVDIIKPKFMQSKKEFHFWLNTFFVDCEFGFSNVAGGLAHQVLETGNTSGNLSPASLWTDAAQPASAPPTANINIAQTQEPFFPTSMFHGDQEQISHEQHACTETSGNRSGSGGLQQQTTEETIIVEEQENEDEVNTDLQGLTIEFKQENKQNYPDEEKQTHGSVCQICCMKHNETLQLEGTAPQLQSKVVIEETDDSSIRFDQKTENQLQCSSNDVPYCSGTTSICNLSCHSSLQQNDGEDSGCSSSLQTDAGTQCGNNSVSLTSPPVSPNCASSEGSCCLTNSSVERKCSGGSDPGSTSASSGSTMPISQFHHHNIHSGCNSNANALPERHVSGGFTAPPSRQTSDPSGTSSSSTTATTPSSGSVQTPDTPSVSVISTPSSGTGMAQTYTMTTSSDQTTANVNMPHKDLPCNLVNTAAISDDLLLREQQQQRLQFSVTFADNVPRSPEQSNAEDNNVAGNSTSSGSTTATSFDLLNGNSRLRHTSVPQAARNTTTANTHVSAERARQLALHHHASLMNENGKQHTIHGTGMSRSRSSRVQIDGSKLSLRLTKSQIDNAAKSKRKMYQENFSVTLFLVKPKDQSENLTDYTLPCEMSTSRNANGNSSQHDIHKNNLNTHAPLANSSSESAVAMSTGCMGEGCTTVSTTNSLYNHLHNRPANSKNLLRFSVTTKGQKPGNSNIEKTKFESNSSPESSSEDDMASIEMASVLGINERKGILRKNNSNCSSTRVIAPFTKTKASGLETDSAAQTSSTVSSHQLMTSASEVMHRCLRTECAYPSKGGEVNTVSSDSADILHMRRLSSDRTAPPTDNADTSITRTCTTTVTSGTSDFVVVSLSDCTGSAVSHVNHVNNATTHLDSPREPSDHKTTVTTTPSTSAVHHHSHHPMSAGPAPANTLKTHQSTWI